MLANLAEVAQFGRVEADGFERQRDELAAAILRHDQPVSYFDVQRGGVCAGPCSKERGHFRS